MKIMITRTKQIGDKIEVTFKYWGNKQCACEAKVAKKLFDSIPSSAELLKSVNL